MVGVGLPKGSVEPPSFPKGSIELPAFPKGSTRAACLPEGINSTACLHPDPAHENPGLGKSPGNAEPGRSCFSGPMSGGRRGGKRPSEEEKREQEGRYTEAARKDHAVLLSRRPSRRPPWLPGFRPPTEGATKQGQLVPQTVQSADQRGQAPGQDADRRALFPSRHYLCKGKISSFTVCWRYAGRTFRCVTTGRPRGARQGYGTGEKAPGNPGARSTGTGARGPSDRARLDPVGPRPALRGEAIVDLGVRAREEHAGRRDPGASPGRHALPVERARPRGLARGPAPARLPASRGGRQPKWYRASARDRLRSGDAAQRRRGGGQSNRWTVEQSGPHAPGGTEEENPLESRKSGCSPEGPRD